MDKYKILFVYAHPDDESLWSGGTLSSFNKFDFIDTYIAVLSGKNSERYQEFKEAVQIINPTKQAVSPHPLAKTGNVLLTDVADNLFLCLEEMSERLDEFDLVVTHSYYGDEHAHPQHMQVFLEIQKLCSNSEVPLAFVSFMPIPLLTLTPLLVDLRRGNGLHLLGMYRCNDHASPAISKLRLPCTPEYFIQFKVDQQNKNKILNCYQSINLREHEEVYAAWDSSVEGYYLLDQKGLRPFIQIQKALKPPSRHKLTF